MNTNKFNLKKYLDSQAKVINKHLKKYCNSKANGLEKSIEYSLMAQGKRIRPILVMEAAKVCGLNPVNVMPACCAVEMIHTYSLIHDDLPSMDNDDLRRGKPANHKMYGESTAVLAGDALLTDAFFALSTLSYNKKVKPKNIVRAVSILSEHAGSRGMVIGQYEDTVQSGAWRELKEKDKKKLLYRIHNNKTGKLLSACLLIGAVLADADRSKQKALIKYAENIGLAFQVCDDILDVTGNKKLMGKKGSDAGNSKLTFPALYGIEESMKIARRLIKNAKKSLHMFKNAQVLLGLADYIIERKF